MKFQQFHAYWARTPRFLGAAGLLALLVLPSAASAQPPVIRENGVVNAASMRPSFSPGTRFLILGSGLAKSGRATGESDRAEGSLPVVLDGVQVRIAGVAVPLLSIAQNRIEGIIPALETSGTHTIEVQTADGSATAEIDVASFSPAVYTDSGTALASITNGDGIALPAARSGDSIIITGTGWGPTDPPVPPHLWFEGSASLLESSRFSVRIAGAEAPVQFAGLVGTGLYAALLTMPDLPTGKHPLFVTVNGIDSPLVEIQSLAGADSLLTADKKSLTITLETNVRETIEVSVGSFPAGASVKVVASENWLAVSPSNGIAPLSFSIGLNTAGLAPGAYQSFLRIESATAVNSPLVVPVSLQVTASTLPQITRTNATSIAQSSTIPYFTVYGMNLEGVTSLEFTPREGITITGLTARRISVEATVRVDIAAAAGTRQLTAVSRRGRSAPIPISILPINPTAGPTIVSVYPGEFVWGQTAILRVYSTRTNGFNTLEVQPSQGLTISKTVDWSDPNQAAGPTPTWWAISVAANATPGVRMLNLATSTAKTNAVPILIKAGSPSVTRIKPETVWPGRVYISGVPSALGISGPCGPLPSDAVCSSVTHLYVPTPGNRPMNAFLVEGADLGGVSRATFSRGMSGTLAGTGGLVLRGSSGTRTLASPNFANTNETLFGLLAIEPSASPGTASITMAAPSGTTVSLPVTIALPSPNAPKLDGVTLAVASGPTVRLTGNMRFTDADGDIGPAPSQLFAVLIDPVEAWFVGAFHLPASRLTITGKNSGTISFNDTIFGLGFSFAGPSLTAVVWIEDAAGNPSNAVRVPVSTWPY